MRDIVLALRIELSAEAEKDLDAIIDFGSERFGPRQAIDYAQGLVARLDDIALQPLHHQSVGRFRRAVYKAHAVYFVETDTTLRIERIIGKQAFPEAFLDFD